MAMSASDAPTTQMLWLSCPTEEASAPSRNWKPLAKPRPTFWLVPWRAKTQIFRMSRSGSATSFPSFAGTSRRRWAVMIFPGRTPITDWTEPRAGTAKSSAVTGWSLTERSPTGLTAGRPAKVSGVTTRPLRMTRLTAHSSRSSSSTRSARCPGAISPRSNRPKPRAADHVAAR